MMYAADDAVVVAPGVTTGYRTVSAPVPLKMVLFA
jgi:hypothetical protein